MDQSQIIEFVLRFLHIFTAITLIGGGIYRLFIAGPVIRQLNPDQNHQIKKDFAARWKFFVHIGILVFLVSGLALFMYGLKYHRQDYLYHSLIGIKMILGIVVFFVISALVGRSEKLGFFRKKSSGSLVVVLFLSVIIVGIASFLKTRGPQNWPAEKEPLPIKASSLKKGKPEAEENSGNKSGNSENGKEDEKDPTPEKEQTAPKPEDKKDGGQKSETENK